MFDLFLRQPKVSVIIPNFNYGNFVSQAVESVLAQTYNNLEVIVVNNGSSDNSFEVLQGFKEQIILIDQPNLGQSGARMSGLAKASGDVIAFLDADDYWHPKKLEKQIGMLDSTHQVIYCGIEVLDDQKKEVTSSLLPKFRGDCSSRYISNPGESVVLSAESTALFTRAIMDTVGGFDKELNSAAGWDFFRRCSKFTNFEYVNEALTVYRVHSRNMSNQVSLVVEDVRKAYIKLITDPFWKINLYGKIQLALYLEYSFFKTYLRNCQLRNASYVALGKYLKTYFV